MNGVLASDSPDLKPADSDRMPTESGPSSGPFSFSGPRVTVTAMDLVDGVQHVTFLSDDLDRLAAFYEDVFGARKTLDLTEEGLRHVFIEVGAKTVLHPFQLLDGRSLPEAPGTMFERGRLDHFALLAPSRDAFAELRRRLEAEGAADGDVRDMGTMWIMGFHDPDGSYAEVVWRKPGGPDENTLARADWTTVDLP
jgi:catechol 2,3-dioxygenase-like lactoylglutathione lyase family enzyme